MLSFISGLPLVLSDCPYQAVTALLTGSAYIWVAPSQVQTILSLAAVFSLVKQ